MEHVIDFLWPALPWIAVGLLLTVFFAKNAGKEKRIIYVDKETGVNYLYVQNGYSGGMTPLLDVDGKPVITK